MTDELITDRLILRPLAQADLKDIAAMDADAQVMRFLAEDPVRSRARYRATIKGEGRPWGLWSVRLLAGGAFIGLVGLTPLGTHIELTAKLAQAGWHQGFGTEAARALIGHGFGLGLPRIVALSLSANARAGQCLSRLGFVRRQTRVRGGREVSGWVLERPAAQDARS